MIRRNPEGNFPKIDKTAFIDPSAIVIGRVKIGRNVFVAPGAVIRADEPESSIIIGDNANIQDRAVVHALGKSSVSIGENVSLSHGSIVHGPCRIGKGCFIGFGSVVFRCALGSKVFIKNLAVVEDVEVPPQRLVHSGAVINSQSMVDSLVCISGEHAEFSENVVKMNLDLVKGYKKQED